MAQEQEQAGEVVLVHPNREKAESKATRAVVVLLMVVSAVLILWVLIGGWKVVNSMASLTAVYVILYLGMAYFTARWRKGMLPVAAALGVVVMTNAVIAIPSWNDRHAVGYTVHTASPTLMAILCAILVPVQLLLIIFSLRGFRQNWNVVVERLPDGTTRKVATF